MHYPTIAHIDLEALHHNLNQIKKTAPKSKILAMVKRDAYGHSAVEIAKSLEPDVQAFGVFYLQEALQLKNAGIKKPIVVTADFFDNEELVAIDQNGFECVIHNFFQLEILARAKLTKPLRVWLKIDTGMHRLGFQPSQVHEAYYKLMQNSMVQKPLRFFTHFSDADDFQTDKTAKQILLFEKIVNGLEGEWCLANSAAVLHWPKSHADWIRPGIALYGISPFEDKNGPELNLKPVMTLTSHIMTIHDLEKGETIGYGSTFTCPQKMRVGVVATGYGSGYPRNTKTGAPILVTDMPTQLIGRVAMDMIGVDLRLIPHAEVGSVVILWGRGLPIEEVANWTGEYRYELVSRLTSRVHYKFYQRSVDLVI